MIEHSQRDSVRKWAEFTIQRFREAQNSAGVRHTGALFNSFTERIITGSNGNVLQVEIKFKYYLRFLDMGVKKGVHLGSPEVRPKTKLYSKIKISRVKSFADMMATHYGITTVGLIETKINNLNINI